MKNFTFGSWVGPALGIAGVFGGLSASDAIRGGAFAGLLAGSVWAVWGIARWRASPRAA